MSILRRLYRSKRGTDFEKIKVSSNGDFSMSSKDIFDDKAKALKLIHKFKAAVKGYNSHHQEIDTPTIQSFAK